MRPHFFRLMALPIAAACLAASPAAAQQAGAARAAATPARAAGAASPLLGDYRLSAGDKLRIEVYKDAQLSQSLQVRPDGKITLPLLGDIAAAGQTPIQLRDQIAASLKEYVTNPVVTVIVVEASAPVIYVMGEVHTPGAQQMKGRLTAMQALALAGGFTEFADRKDVRVLRRGPAGVQSLKFNYKNAAKGEGDDLVLQAGDTIIVP